MGLFGKSNRPNIEKMKEERDVEGLIGTLGDDHPDVRNAVIEALSNMDDPRVVDALIATLTDEDATVRYCTTRALGNLVVAGPDARAVEALIAVLKDEDSDVRICAGQALSNINDPGVVDALIAALKDENWADRGVAALVFGQLVGSAPGIGDPRVIETLIAALKDEDAGVRKGSAMALGAQRDKRALEPLLTASVAEEDPDARSSMDEAVVMISGIREFRQNLDEMLPT